jgi:hypothetical protein
MVTDSQGRIRPDIWSLMRICSKRSTTRSSTLLCSPLCKGCTTHFIGGHTSSLAVTPPVTPLPSQTQKGRRSPPRSPQTGPSIPGRVCTVDPPWEVLPRARKSEESVGGVATKRWVERVSVCFGRESTTKVYLAEQCNGAPQFLPRHIKRAVCQKGQVAHRLLRVTGYNKDATIAGQCARYVGARHLNDVSKVRGLQITRRITQ